MSKPTEDDLINELEQPRKAIVKMLKKQSWKVLLAGNTGVVKNPNNPLEHNYWFIFEFIGGKRTIKRASIPPQAKASGILEEFL